ncbi:MAG: Oxygen regulatory protein NreC [Planctomycetes bacterium ADurb.Bin126]|nr:MAG: Oxygen regulatory protein NreC [Planctomycetes bacterium ADurb.Bin126]HOD79789.1 response regulator transcription factor [Phycisphaerae bacterium]HQL72797.1 response regulator transcription factor [Phycisphaerae bacterium]
MSTRVLLADDHQIVLEGLGGLLRVQDGWELVGTATSGREAVELARRTRPDVVVMDVTMPDLDGVTATRAILSARRSTRVLALSMHCSGEIALRMFRAGARGYVVKSNSIEDILVGIRAVVDGRRYVSPLLAGELPLERLEELLQQESPADALSRREREVLCLVAQGMSTKQIAAELHVAKRTIDWHRRNIMDRVNIRTVAELTKFAIREGLTTLQA